LLTIKLTKFVQCSLQLSKKQRRLVGQGLLCSGKLVNAWGLGGLCNAHSNPGAHLSLSKRK